MLSVLLISFLAPIHLPAQELNSVAVDFFQKALVESDLDKKIEYFEKAVDLEPDYREARYRLGISYFRKGRFQESIDFLARFRDEASDSYKEARLYLRNAYTFRANELNAQDKFEQALLASHEALALDANYVPALTAAGQSYFYLRDWQPAISNLKISIKIDPNQELAWNTLGDVYMRIEDYHLAQKAYTRVLTINPKNRQAQFHLKVAMKRNRPEVWLQKFDAAIIDNDLEEGIFVLREALELHPGHPEISQKLRLSENKLYYENAVKAIEAEDWLLAYDLLRAADGTFKNTDDLLLKLRTEFALDGLSSLVPSQGDTSSVRKNIGVPARTPTRTASENASPHPDSMQESAVATGPQLDAAATEKTDTESRVELPEDTVSDIERSAPGLISADTTFRDFDERADANSPFAWFDSDKFKQTLSQNWVWIVLAVGAVFIILLIIGSSIKKSTKVPDSTVLEATLRESFNRESPARPADSHETFYDKIASKTPVKFDDTSSPGMFGLDDTLFSGGETRTMVGGIKKVPQIGRYVIEKEIGRGSMGLVFKAWDPKLDRTVVIKQVALTSTGSTEAMRLKDRLYREARAAGKLNHANIVIIYDVEEENNCSYIVMEYLEGQNLRDIMDGDKKPSVIRSIDIVSEICHALEFAHQNGIIHRDIKPSNIMIGANKVKVADFGIAKLPQFGTLTRTGDIVGTPFYMSPEQIEGRSVDGRADIFSTAVLLYEMLTGRRPFDGDNIPAIVYKIVHQKPKNASKVNKQLPSQIDEILTKAMAKEAENRYKSARDFRQAIEFVRDELTEP